MRSIFGEGSIIRNRTLFSSLFPPFLPQFPCLFQNRINNAVNIIHNLGITEPYNAKTLRPKKSLPFIITLET